MGDKDRESGVAETVSAPSTPNMSSQERRRATALDARIRFVYDEGGTLAPHRTRTKGGVAQHGCRGVGTSDPHERRPGEVMDLSDAESIASSASTQSRKRGRPESTGEYTFKKLLRAAAGEKRVGQREREFADSLPAGALQRGAVINTGRATESRMREPARSLCSLAGPGEVMDLSDAETIASSASTQSRKRGRPESTGEYTFKKLLRAAAGEKRVGKREREFADSLPAGALQRGAAINTGRATESRMRELANNPSVDLAASILERMTVVKRVAKTSGNLKGTYIRAFQEASIEVRAALSIMMQRSADGGAEETNILRQEVESLTAQVRELRKALRDVGNRGDGEAEETNILRQEVESLTAQVRELRKALRDVGNRGGVNPPPSRRVRRAEGGRRRGVCPAHLNAQRREDKGIDPDPLNLSRGGGPPTWRDHPPPNGWPRRRGREQDAPPTPAEVGRSRRDGKTRPQQQNGGGQEGKGWERKGEELGRAGGNPRPTGAPPVTPTVSGEGAHATASAPLDHTGRGLGAGGGGQGGPSGQEGYPPFGTAPTDDEAWMSAPAIWGEGRKPRVRKPPASVAVTLNGPEEGYAAAMAAFNAPAIWGEGRKPRVRKPPASVAVTLNGPEEGYAAAMAAFKAAIKLGDLGIAHVRVKRALRGARILKVPGPDAHAKADTLAGAIRGVLNEEQWSVVCPTKRAEMMVRGLEDSSRPAKWRGASPRCSSTSVETGPIKTALDGLGRIWVRCPAVGALKVANPNTPRRRRMSAALPRRRLQRSSASLNDPVQTPGQ
ncbi:hypothetical protein X777_06917 [Ooceraea biroi]|uniref:Gag-like protein n=1 Tax=Ooceraea biroi TaxID=2015173 RepID=A0A026WC18_OOCBI|nr:hypothetical protein X777_06917 [Ooceraea biroi]